MTREEIQTQCLELPEAERAALAERLASSLNDPERLHALTEALEALEKERLEAMRRRLEAEMATWFEEESIEVTDEVWQQITSKEITEEELDTPFGVEVPPEWTGKTLRELIAATRK